MPSWPRAQWVLTSAQSLQQDNVRLAFILQADNQGNDYQGVTAPRALSHMRRYLSVKSVSASLALAEYRSRAPAGDKPAENPR